MAKAKNNPNQETKVRRVKANDERKPALKKPTLRKQQPKAAVVVNGDEGERKANIIRRFLGYFKGAWQELRLVRWPNRRATISMSIALLIFTGLFTALIQVIDLAFETLFKLILG